MSCIELSANVLSVVGTSGDDACQPLGSAKLTDALVSPSPTTKSGRPTMQHGFAEYRRSLLVARRPWLSRERKVDVIHDTAESNRAAPGRSARAKSRPFPRA